MGAWHLKLPPIVLGLLLLCTTKAADSSTNDTAGHNENATTSSRNITTRETENKYGNYSTDSQENSRTKKQIEIVSDTERKIIKTLTYITGKEFEDVRRGTIFVGGPRSGKTTLALLLAEFPGLKAIESNTEILIVDDGTRIGRRTIHPEALNNSAVDFPRFGSGEDISEELAAAYLATDALREIGSAKIVLCSQKCSGCTKEEKETKIFEDFTRFYNFLVDIEWFSDSLVFALTKATEEDRRSSSDYGKQIQEAVELLKYAASVAEEKLKKEDISEEEKASLEGIIALLAIFKADANIVVSLAPAQATENLDDDQNIKVTVENLKKSLQITDFTVLPKNTYHPLSSAAKTEAQYFKNFSILTGASVIKKTFDSAHAQIEKFVMKDDKGIHTVNEFYFNITTGLKSLLANVEAATEITDLMEQLSEVLSELGIKVPPTYVKAFQKFSGYTALLENILQEEDKFSFKEIMETSGNFLLKQIEPSAQWTKYVVALYEYLSSTSFQMERFKYNVADIEADWGKGGTGVAEGINIKRSNFRVFYQKITELNSSFSEFNNFINDTDPTEKQVNLINAVTNETIVDEKRCVCAPTGVFAFQNFFNDNTWSNCVTVADCRKTFPYTNDSYHIIALNVIYATKPKAHMATFSYVSPKISIITESNFWVKGWAGSRGGPSPREIHIHRHKFNQFNFLNYKEAPDGNMGIEGSSRLGVIFVATRETQGPGKLTIDTFGGQGGPGQLGAHTTEIYDYWLTNPTTLCSFIQDLRRGVIEGGAGGYGSFPNPVLFFATRDTFAHFGANQFYGRRGYPERGITRSIVVNHKGALKVCDDKHIPGYGQSKQGIQAKPKQAKFSGSQYLFVLNEYRKFSIDRLNILNFDTITKFLNFLYQEDSQVKSLANTEAFAGEALSLVLAWYPGKTSRLTEFVIATQLSLLDKRVAEYLKSPIPLLPFVHCSRKEDTNFDTEECVECDGERCYTTLRPGPSEATLNHTKALMAIRNAVTSQLTTIQRNRDNHLVTDIDSFLELVEDRVTRFKLDKEKNDDLKAKLEAAQAMENINKDYLGSIEKKVQQVEGIIKNQLQPELRKASGAVKDIIRDLSKEIDDKLNDKKAQGADINKAKEKLKKGVRTKGFISQVTYGLTALEVAGDLSMKMAGAFGNKLAGDVKNFLFEGEPTKEYYEEVTKQSNANLEEMKKFLQTSQKYYNDELFLAYNDLSDFFVKALQQTNNNPKMKSASDFFDKAFSDLKKLIDGDGTVLVEYFDEILGIHDKIFDGISSTGAEIITPLLGETAGGFWKTYWGGVSSAFNFLKGGIPGIFNRNDNKKHIKAADDALKAVAGEMGGLYQMKQYLNSVISNQAHMIEDVTNSLASGKLSGATLGRIDQERHRGQQMIAQFRDHIQSFSKSLKIPSEVQTVTRKMEATLNALTNAHERVATYREHQDFASYIYAINKAALNVKIPTELEKAITKLDMAVDINTIMWFYNKALNAFTQYVFPLASRYPELMNIDLSRDNIGELIGTVLRQILALREHLKYEKSVVVGGQDEHRHYRSFYPTKAATPFFTWSSDDYQENINSLFDGEAVVFSANILETPMEYDAVKFNVIDILFHVRETEEDHENLNEMLKSRLDYFHVHITHTGDNYYRFEDKFYPLTTDSLTFKFSMEVDNNGDRTDKNAAYKKVEAGDLVLSPYTIWEIKLELSPRGKDEGINLDIFKDVKVDLMLCGKGTYISPTIYDEGIAFNTQEYYKEDEALGRLSASVIKETDSGTFESGRKLRVQMDGSDWIVKQKPELDLDISGYLRRARLARDSVRNAGFPGNGSLPNGGDGGAQYLTGGDGDPGTLSSGGARFLPDGPGGDNGNGGNGNPVPPGGNNGNRDNWNQGPPNSNNGNGGDKNSGPQGGNNGNGGNGNPGPPGGNNENGGNWNQGPPSGNNGNGGNENSGPQGGNNRNRGNGNPGPTGGNNGNGGNWNPGAPGGNNGNGGNGNPGPQNPNQFHSARPNPMYGAAPAG